MHSAQGMPDVAAGALPQAPTWSQDWLLADLPMLLNFPSDAASAAHVEDVPSPHLGGEEALDSLWNSSLDFGWSALSGQSKFF